MSEYTLYAAPNTYAMSVHAILEEVKANYDVKWIEIFTDKPDPTFRSISPHCRSPALMTPDGGVFETGAIAMYLGEKFPKFNLSNQKLNLDERANNLIVQDAISSSQSSKVIPKNITKNLVESADTESQQEDVQNAQQNVQNKAVIFVESPTYDTHPYDINESIYDSEGNLIANYPPELETLYNNFNQSQTNIEDIKNP